MKSATSLSALAALLTLTSASALPNAPSNSKRDLCTSSWGFQYWCMDSGSGSGSSAGSGSSPTSVPAVPAPSSPSEPSSSAASPAPTGSNGGSGRSSSTGGSSGYSGGSTADDITSGTGCTPLTVIFARGTSEGGNIGSVIGPPMFEDLLSDVGADSLTLQGVDYPASAAGNANCGAAGGGDMADKVATIQSACPDTQIVLSGYSQGACVVHNALSSAGASGIAGAVVFGDPFNGQSFDGVDDSNVLSVCRSDDGICNRGPSSGSGGHISYGSSAQEAATFIEGIAGL